VASNDTMFLSSIIKCFEITRKFVFVLINWSNAMISEFIIIIQLAPVAARSKARMYNLEPLKHWVHEFEF
jgi:hypothetical protein